MVHQHRAIDRWTTAVSYIVVAAIVAVVASLACIVPTRLAARIDRLIALRS